MRLRGFVRAHRSAQTPPTRMPRNDATCTGTVAAVAAVAESDQRLARESADLLYHLLILWHAKGLSPAEVWAEMDKRFGTSGTAIKEVRKKG